MRQIGKGDFSVVPCMGHILKLQGLVALAGLVQFIMACVAVWSEAGMVCGGATKGADLTGEDKTFFASHAWNVLHVLVIISFVILGLVCTCCMCIVACVGTAGLAAYTAQGQMQQQLNQEEGGSLETALIDRNDDCYKYFHDI